jgi:prepilin-type N-terminal cleavage/methylation domain-containing protein
MLILRNYKEAFSLVELSIVIIIIGILITGVSVGSKLVHEASLKKIMLNVENYRTSVNIFKATYDALPGDLDIASNYWNTANGNNDGYVNYIANSAGSGISEASTANQHLSLAELINGSFENGQNMAANNIGLNTALNAQILLSSWTIPGSQYLHGGVNWNIHHLVATSKVAIHVGKPWNGSYTHAIIPVISTEDAFNIDNKFDDSLPKSGKISGGNDYAFQVTNSGNCLNALAPNTTQKPIYDMTDTNSIKCNLNFNLD